MSYSILYDRQFVKIAEDKYIPMMLVGDNNMWENNSKKRCRDWGNSPWYTAGKPYASEEEIMKRLDDYMAKEKKDHDREEKDETGKHVGGYTFDKNYGWFTGTVVRSGHTTKTTATQYRNFILSGIKKAWTIEQLREAGIKLLLGGDMFTSQFPKVEIHSIEDIDVYYRAVPEGEFVYFYFGTPGNTRDYESINYKIKHYRRKINPKPKREKVKVKLDKYYVLKNDNGFLSKYTKSGYRYNPWGSDTGKIFETRKLAEKYRDKLVKDNKFKAESWKVKPINEKVFVYK